MIQEQNIVLASLIFLILAIRYAYKINKQTKIEAKEYNELLNK